MTLLTLEALEAMLPAIADREVATSVKVELAERRRSIKRHGSDILLRAALIHRYGLRIEGGNS